MTLPSGRTWRAGQSILDQCRACKADRLHTIIVVDDQGLPLRVSCGFCGSDHNYRGGPLYQPAARVERSSTAPRARTSVPSADPFPLVSERERRHAPVSLEGTPDLELLLRRIIREETGLTEAVPADKWRGGELVLRPGKPGVQEKSWPIESFFHKVVMLRNRLRTLEQQVNASDLPDEMKVRLQSYITGCYGSLTSFNVLFADEDDKFEGSSTD